MDFCTGVSFGKSLVWCCQKYFGLSTATEVFGRLRNVVSFKEGGVLEFEFTCDSFWRVSLECDERRYRRSLLIFMDTVVKTACP